MRIGRSCAVAQHLHVLSGTGQYIGYYGIFWGPRLSLPEQAALVPNRQMCTAVHAAVEGLNNVLATAILFTTKRILWVPKPAVLLSCQKYRHGTPSGHRCMPVFVTWIWAIVDVAAVRAAEAVFQTLSAPSQNLSLGGAGSRTSREQGQSSKPPYLPGASSMLHRRAILQS